MSDSPSLLDLLQRKFGFSSFRPYQEAVCRAGFEGRDLLLVMPTGAGKSLCYQLPGFARQGTTLVISPLVALMEDQVAKLKQMGLRAEAIHSAKDRAASRQVCVDYLKGALDFLFVAPERLAFSGFLEMLAKRRLALIAVDEAHCISQWGHDFRPDYRLIGERLPALRPAPVIAMTATATPRVQDDIVAQLGLKNAERFIHGFRRSNIGIEIVEFKPSERSDAVARLLADAARRPAIVYAPTRKEAEGLAVTLKAKFPAAAYHAGLSPDKREDVQSRFLARKLEVIVATIAFGMGIDKPDVRTVVHTALPSSVEGYYQEIGRAGRDGKPSRAVLMYSFADRRTHEFFHERDYPEPALLKRIFVALPQDQGVDRETLGRKTGLDPAEFERAFQKLRIHGGAGGSEDEGYCRGDGKWEQRYVAQRSHRMTQLAQMTRYADSHGCRMTQLVQYFGDQEDEGAACGLCDICAPNQALLRQYRETKPEEDHALKRIMETLARVEDMATGRLFQTAFESGEIERRSFEHLLGGLVRAGVVQLRNDSFEKDGRRIDYVRAALTRQGRLAASHEDAGIRVTVQMTERAPAKKRRRKRSARASSYQ